MFPVPRQHFHLPTPQGQQRAPQGRGLGGQKRNQNHQKRGAMNVVVVVPAII